MHVCSRNLERLTHMQLCRPAVLLLGLLLHACGLSSAVGDDYILLRNGNVIQGTAVPVGHEMLVRRPGGSELKLDARQVVFAAGSLGELYEFRVGSRQISDASSHHDDARWCLRNGLYAQMKQSLDEAEAYTPGHPETLRLRRQLQAAIAPAGDSASRDSIQTAAWNEPEVPEPSHAAPLQHSDEDLSILNVSSESLVFFTSRVQPILINRCGNTGCHRSPSETTWGLTHLGVHARPPSRMTRLNLVAALKLVDTAEPLESDLLRYAVHPHGGRREPPLRRSDEVALESLRHWAQAVADATSGDLHAPLLPAAEPSVYAAGSSGRVAMAPTGVATAGWTASLDRLPVHPAQFVDGASGAGEAVSSRTADGALVPAPNMAPSSPWQPAGPRATTAPVAAGQLGRPTRLPAVSNPFDPAVFNRHYRLQGSTASEGM